MFPFESSREAAPLSYYVHISLVIIYIVQSVKYCLNTSQVYTLIFTWYPILMSFEQT